MAEPVTVEARALQDAMTRRGRIFAPAGDGRWVVHTGETLPELGPIRPRRPLKDLFAPPFRTVARIVGASAEAELLAPRPEDAPGTVFGVRPCDARALRLLDRVFLPAPYTDPFYSRRREALTLVGVACQPAESCCCGVFGYGPDDTLGLDLMLYPQSGGFLAASVTAKGDELLQAADGTRPSAVPPQLRSGPRPAWWKELPHPEALLAAFEDPVWERLSVGCMSCGVCTLYCPTCHCFNLVDEPYKAEVLRLRIADTCQSSDFTRMAGGHNPRASAARRLRQRVLHKFAYIPTTNGGLPGCTGCGRCVEGCGLRRHLFADLEELRQVVGAEAGCRA